MKRPAKKKAAKRMRKSSRAKPMPAAEPTRVLVLRTCSADLSSHSGFRWPESGPVECTDWDSKPECGNGLHGLLWGEGDGTLLNWSPDARWLVVEVDAAIVVDLGGKVKFPRGEVVHCGTRESATEWIVEHGALGRAIVGMTATAGDEGTATAGDEGTATAGYAGTATAGARGTATAGDGGVLIIRRLNREARRYQLSVAKVGENGIKPNVQYRLDDAGKFVEISKSETSKPKRSEAML